jgi:hypothetical protein
MEISDLFGDGAVLSGGKLTIPRANLTGVGLDVGSTNERAALAAVFKIAAQYFDGPLIDSDGASLIDSDGEPFYFQNYRLDQDVSFLPISRILNSDETLLYWRWLISFYEVI